MSDLKKKTINVDDEDDEDKKEGGDKGFSWEEEFKRSWDVVQEDDQGSLTSLVANLQQQLKKRRSQRDTSIVQRGIIRYLILIVDLSEAMAEKDLRPTRIGLTASYLAEFVHEYFDQNPISQLGIIGTRNGLAERISELSGNPMEHIKALKMRANQETSGEPSLQNALYLAQSSLVHVPRHASREVLCIFGSLTTCDPGNLLDTISQLQENNIRCSMIGLAAEVSVFKRLCTKTNGEYSVAFNEHHYRDILFDTTHPPPIPKSQAHETTLKLMGFPRRCSDNDSSLCSCHGDPSTNPNQSASAGGGYKCPRCHAKVCELPTDCNQCSLKLISSPHLARSYHHLFPVPNFQELPISQIRGTTCTGCFDKLQPTSPRPSSAQTPSAATCYQCPLCKSPFCLDCDIFIHDALHNCPGCTMI